MNTADTDWGGGLVASKAIETSLPRVLVAGNGPDIAALAKFLMEEGFAARHVSNSWAAVECLKRDTWDVVVVDQDLPGINGTGVCRRAKGDPSTRLLPVVLLVLDQGSGEERLDAIEAGVDQIVPSPFDARELIATLRALVRRKRYTDDFEFAASVMTTLSTMIEARDRYSEGHCHRMANHAAALGRRIGLAAEEIHILRRGGFLHDIGMLAIPDALLLKPAGLDEDERALIRSHPVVGESLISNLRSLQPIRSIVRHHHERRDGSGYPDGLQGDDIPLPAQIVGLVDGFEAMTSSRPYQRTLSPREALDVLHRQAKKGWHREDLFDEFARVIDAA